MPRDPRWCTNRLRSANRQLDAGIRISRAVGGEIPRILRSSRGFPISPNGSHCAPAYHRGGDVVPAHNG
jgi:hypothetical protein